MEEVHPIPVQPLVDSGETSPVNNNTKPGSILRVETDNEEEEDLQSQQENRSPSVLPKQSWLLRLFESTLFDPSMAMTYLFNSKALTDIFCCWKYFNILFQEPGVLEYIGNKEKMINIYISKSPVRLRSSNCLLSMVLIERNGNWLSCSPVIHVCRH